MNSPAINRDENKFSKFAQDLQGVNDDWPLLGELSQKKFVLKNKKSNLNVAKTTKKMMEFSSLEDSQMSERTVQDDKLFEESFVKEFHDFKDSPEVLKTVANDINEKFIKIENEAPVVAAQPIKIPPVFQEKVVAPRSIIVSQEDRFTNPLLKLIAIGLTKLYVKKTTSVLNPVKFVAENYKNVSIAILHLGMPILMSWLLITKVGFINSQLVNTPSVMFWTYSLMFYFASLFVWVTGQVLFAGLLSMFKTTLISVAKDVENRE